MILARDICVLAIAVVAFIVLGVEVGRALIIFVVQVVFAAL